MGLCFDFSCENGGTCKSIQQKAKCFCPIPYFGLHCEKTGLIEKSVGLKGDGFLQFGKNNYDNIILYFSTEDYNSILLKYEANEIGLDVYSEYKIYCFNSILHLSKNAEKSCLFCLLIHFSEEIAGLSFS